MTTFKNTIINDTTYIQPPRGTTSQRPTIYTNIIRWTNTGSQSYSVLAGVTPTLSNTSWTAPTGVTQVEVLVVGGGGGGGGNKAGGGGGGGVIYNSAYTVTPGSSYTVTVGAGGAGANGSTNAGSTGGSSVFDTLTATGGGGGATDTANTPNNGIAGASGGGGARGGTGGAGTAALGFSGGNASNNANGYGGGGGGGAGGPGSNGHGFFGGGGGPGLNFNISGTPTWYAGGGGGMNYYTGLGGNYGGAGGIGGGGAGTSGGTAGTASTGGGGGGSDNSQAGYSAAFGGAGGSGVVIIRYVVASDNTDPRGLLRYNTDLNDIEVYENSYTGWCPQDPTRNFGGHNLIPASQTFYASAASTSNVSSTAIDDPFGGQNARRVTYLASGSASINTQSASVIANAVYVFSVYMRKVTGNVTNSTYSYNSVSGGAAPITTSWAVSGLSASLSTTTYTRVWATYVWASTGTVSIVMPGYDAGNGVVMDYYGPQIELASTMGPYVNTNGAASPVPTVLNGYRTHTYTTTGTSGFTPSVTGTVEVLVVGGGGGGGANHAGGGGAGGVLYASEYQVISEQQYVVTVGAGGAVGPSYSATQGLNGSNSVFGTLVAAGGGGGGNRRDSGTTGIEFGLWGGSGGGGGGQGSDNTPNIWGGAGTLGQGNKGGNGAFHGGAGGGGAGGPGGSVNASDGALASTTRPGNGGQGMYFSQFAHVGGYPAGWFGGGGAGNAHSAGLSNPATPGWGGGGWPQDQVASGESVNGRANTGGGGGGSTGSGSSGGGSGGSGIVIVRYKN